MSETAKEIRKNPGNYNLYSHNCNQVVQTILDAGGEKFSVDFFDFLDTMPNRVRNNLINSIFETENYYNNPIANPSNVYRDYTGWKFGKIADLYKYVFECGE